MNLVCVLIEKNKIKNMLILVLKQKNFLKQRNFFISKILCSSIKDYENIFLILKLFYSTQLNVKNLYLNQF